MDEKHGRRIPKKIVIPDIFLNTHLIASTDGTKDSDRDHIIASTSSANVVGHALLRKVPSKYRRQNRSQSATIKKLQERVHKLETLIRSQSESIARLENSQLKNQCKMKSQTEIINQTWRDVEEVVQLQNETVTRQWQSLTREVESDMHVLTERIEKQENEVSDLNTFIQIQNTPTTSPGETLEKLKTEVQAQNKSLNKLQNSQREQESVVKIHAEKVNQFERSLSDICNMTMSQDQSVKQLNERLTKQEETQLEHGHVLNIQTEKVTQVENSLSEMDNVGLSQKEKIKRQGQSLCEMENDCQLQTDRVTSQKNSLSKLDIVVTSHGQSLRKLTDDVQTQVEKLIHLQNVQRGQENALKKQTDEVSQHDNTLSDLSNTVPALNTTVTSLCQSLQEVTGEVRGHNGRAQLERDNKIKMQAEKLDQFERRLSNLDKGVQAQKVTKQDSKLDEFVASQGRTVHELKTDIRELNERLMSLNSLENSVTELDKTVKAQSESLAQLKSDLQVQTELVSRQEHSLNKLLSTQEIAHSRFDHMIHLHEEKFINELILLRENTEAQSNILRDHSHLDAAVQTQGQRMRDIMEIVDTLTDRTNEMSAILSIRSVGEKRLTEPETQTAATLIPEQKQTVGGHCLKKKKKGKKWFLRLWKRKTPTESKEPEVTPSTSQDTQELNGTIQEKQGFWTGQKSSRERPKPNCFSSAECKEAEVTPSTSQDTQ